MALKTFINSSYYYLLIALLLLFYFFSAAVGKPLGPYRLLVVTSGSMEPEIARKSVVIIKEQPNYQINDIATYQRQESDRSAGDSSTITHRIIDQRTNNQGMVFYRFKGDRSSLADGWIDHNRVIGEVKAVIPLLGSAALFLQSTLGKFWLIWLPVALIIYAEVYKICQEIQFDSGYNREANL